MSDVITARGLGRRYRSAEALRDASFALAPGSITGLLGRNGAGKSTLMRIIAAQEFATSGIVEVLGENPVENENVLRRMAFVREDQVYPDFKVRHAITAASWFYPQWSAELAEMLVADFDLPLGRPIKKLSRGMRSAVGIVIGLASRAEVTLLDEPYAGLDPVARRIFYDRLLADLAEHPRTVLLSTHLVDEIADLLDHVLIIDRGRIAVDAPADDIRGRAVTVSGPVAAVETIIAAQTVWDRRTLGSRSSVTIAGPLSAADRGRAAALGVDLDPVSLQELVVHIAGSRPDNPSTGAGRASADADQERASA